MFFHHKRESAAFLIGLANSLIFEGRHQDHNAGWQFSRKLQSLVPAMVTCVSATPLVGVTLVMLGVTTVKFTAFDHTPPCRICATPRFDPEVTVATTCVSDRLTTTP